MQNMTFFNIIAVAFSDKSFVEHLKVSAISCNRKGSAGMHTWEKVVDGHHVFIVLYSLTELPMTYMNDV